jgi:hypothetical protein
MTLRATRSQDSVNGRALASGENALVKDVPENQGFTAQIL